jgi:hypothetical protein
VPGILSPGGGGVKRHECEADHSPPSGAEVKNDGAIPPLPHMSSWHSPLIIKHTDNFIFSTFYISYNAYRILVGKPEGKRPLRRPRRRWVDNIKMDLRERGWDDIRLN